MPLQAPWKRPVVGLWFCCDVFRGGFIFLFCSVLGTLSTQRVRFFSDSGKLSVALCSTVVHFLLPPVLSQTPVAHSDAPVPSLWLYLLWPFLSLLSGLCLGCFHTVFQLTVFHHNYQHTMYKIMGFFVTFSYTHPMCLDHTHPPSCPFFSNTSVWGFFPYPLCCFCLFQ